MNSKTLNNTFAIKGDIAYSADKDNLITIKDGYVVCVDGVSKGVYKNLPNEYATLPIIDYNGKLVLPGMIDLHTHAPQNTFRCMHMDLELMDWLNSHTFVEEAKYSDLEYARKAYGIFVNNLKNGATTRAVIFATIHKPATMLLMDMLEAAGIKSYVGLVNMDQNAPSDLRQEDTQETSNTTKKWIDESLDRYSCVKPILTPRFIPACSRKMLEGLRDIVNSTNIPVQSHLSENPGEVELVKKLMPEASYYGDAYSRYNLFGEKGRAIMAHCVFSCDEEVRKMKDNGVYVAHCPSSNMNLLSGIAPIRKYLDAGLNIGLGTDVAGGDSDSVFSEIKTAIRVSKMYWRYIDDSARALTFEEAFYMATKGGGSFFENCGSLEDGYEMDAIVIDDSKYPCATTLSIRDRVERCVYIGADRDAIEAKYIAGVSVKNH